MRTLNPVVPPVSGFVKVTETQIPECRAVRLRFIRHDLCRTHALVPQQFPHRSQGGPFIPTLLNQVVQNRALTINCSPQVHLLAADIYENFVQVPDIERRATAAANPTGVGWPEFQYPQTHRLVADINATPGQQILNIAKTHRESEVEPNGSADNVGVQAVAPVRDFLHPLIVSGEHAIISELI